MRCVLTVEAWAEDLDRSRAALMVGLVGLGRLVVSGGRGWVRSLRAGKVVVRCMRCCTAKIKREGRRGERLSPHSVVLELLAAS